MIDKKIETIAVREGYKNSSEKEHSPAIFLTSSFVFDNAEQADNTFSKKESGNIYTRFTNPSIDLFQKRLAKLEGAQDCIATSTGMSAIFATIMSLLKTGDHIVSSRSIFGTTTIMFNDIVSKFNIDISFADLSDINSWEALIRNNTKIFFLETPSNPLLEVVDIKKLAKISKKHNIILVVDNVILTPIMQRPLELGADLIIHSATKYIDGQGRCLGGAVAGSNDLIEKIDNFIRTTGPSISPFNAWILAKGLETMPIRVKEQFKNANILAHWLEQQNFIEKVYYLGLKSNLGHEIAKNQQSGFGGIVSFEIKGDKKDAFNLINNTKMISITANFGDTRSTIIHPTTTTHGRLTDKERIDSGIKDNLIRVSVGLENIDDIIADLKF